MGAGKSHTCGLRADGTARCWGPEPPSTLDKRGMPDNVPMVSVRARPVWRDWKDQGALYS